MPTANVNGIDIYYEIHGQGEPLVLIAGLGYDLWMWHKMVPGLAQRFQVIAFDNRGVGRSARPAGPYSAQMLAADTVNLLDVVGIESAHVMGHSMGGFVAQALALDHAGKVRKLILSATNFGGPRHVPVTPEALAVLTDMTSDPITRLRRGIVISTAPGFAGEHPERIDEWVQYRVEHPIDPHGYGAQLGIGMALLSEAASFEHRLKDVTAPTLILHGQHDKVVPPENARLLAQQIPNSTTKILPDAGHFFPFEVPDEAVGAVVEFLQG
ncbi:MAG TPA: alpha/beta fold hydrolase [Anaerolineae bacterium]|nr:alpha/beta fold hydrolase [Anaerolineae bacterium]